MWFVNNSYEKNRLYKYNYNTDELTMYGATFANEDGKNITPIYVHCLAEDRNGNIWIGTTSGPLYLSLSDIKMVLTYLHSIKYLVMIIPIMQTIY